MKKLCIVLMLYSGLVYAGDFEVGVKEFHQGNYQQAALHFYECKDTNVFCIHNLGATNLKLDNKAQAKAWFTLASRYGYKQSTLALRQHGWTVPRADLARRPIGQHKTYKSIVGNEYEYDLSKPSDQIKYEVDVGAQMRDEMDIDPRREIEQDMGQHGGGKIR
jgi:hypothetical protein